MYKFERYCQLGLAGFDQPTGLKMDSENCWIRKTATIPWEAIKEKYASLSQVIQVCWSSLCAQHKDRVQVECSFSLAKRCHGLDRIVTKLDTTARSFIALSILVMNVARIAERSLHQLLVELFSKCFDMISSCFFE